MVDPSSASVPPKEGFGRARRLRKQAEFDAVWNSGHFAADDLLVVKAAVGDRTQPARLGLSVGKRVGPAVVRNRWKRLIREAFRTHQSQLPGGLQLVVRPKGGGAPPCFDSVCKSLLRLAKRIDRRTGNR